jgi:hypothetical protein
MMVGELLNDHQCLLLPAPYYEYGMYFNGEGGALQKNHRGGALAKEPNLNRFKPIFSQI